MGKRFAKPYDHERWSAAPVTERPPPTSQPGHLPGVLTRSRGSRGDVILGSASHLDAFSASPLRDIATRRWPWPANRNTSGRAAPVLSYWELRPSLFLRPRRIETELSRDVLNPARVPLSWANSPTLGTYSSPRMRRADIEVPNHAVDMDSWARSACYPRGTFYPLSDTPSTRRCRITSPDFRPCSTRRSHSQAPLCTYTRHLIANQAEGTFGRLPYLLGGNRPS